jgi:alanyl-tRNA synthetase
VIADHIRSSGFLMADGVTPSNEGRGYVLRRIIRRALRHGHKLGTTAAVLPQALPPTLVEQMGEAYPELKSEQARVEKALLAEEEQFARTLDTGMKILEADIAALGDRHGDCRRNRVQAVRHLRFPGGSDRRHRR